MRIVYSIHSPEGYAWDDLYASREAAQAQVDRGEYQGDWERPHVEAQPLWDDGEGPHPAPEYPWHRYWDMVDHHGDPIEKYSGYRLDTRRSWEKPGIGDLATTSEAKLRQAMHGVIGYDGKPFVWRNVVTDGTGDPDEVARVHAEAVARAQEQARAEAPTGEAAKW